MSDENESIPEMARTSTVRRLDIGEAGRAAPVCQAGARVTRSMGCLGAVLLLAVGCGVQPTETSPIAGSRIDLEETVAGWQQAPGSCDSVRENNLRLLTCEGDASQACVVNAGGDVLCKGPQAQLLEEARGGYGATIQMPEGASTLAPYVDALYYEIFWISVIFFVAIVGAMVWFGWQFRRRKGVTSKPPGHHTAMELFWTFSPLILLAYMFHQGFDSYMMMTIPPETSINIRVRAYKWRWEFEQPNGMTEGELMVPVRQPIRMIMASAPTSARPQDGAVLHSFFVPAFRVKRDIVPGMYTSLWFEATRQGRFQIYCTEYCGTGHSRMLSTVEVVSQQEYDDYLRIGPRCPDEIQEDWQWGERLFSSNGCVACHNVEAAAGAGVGPNLANVAGTMQPIEGGAERMADVEYMRESIMEPQAAIVSSYTNAAMPAFALPQTQLDALISYLAHLSSEGGSLELTPHCGDAAAAAAPPTE